MMIAYQGPAIAPHSPPLARKTTIRRSSIRCSFSSDTTRHHPPPSITYTDVAKHAATLLLTASLSLSLPAIATATATATADDPPQPPPSSNPIRSFANWYRQNQQKNGGTFLLGPIELSRQRLLTAADAVKLNDAPAALAAVRLASMDCVVFDFDKQGGGFKNDMTTASSSSQEYKLGDPCVYRLVYKNATTLTRDSTLVAVTQSNMHRIINQLSLLDEVLSQSIDGGGGGGGEGVGVQDGGRVEGLLQEALLTNTEFEQNVKRCLGLPDGSEGS